jgi:DNA-binding CsgD family transcriptional regulator
MFEIAQTLRRSIQFDALLIGTGTSNQDGSVSIGDTQRVNLPAEFVDEYPDVSSADVVAQVFAALPHTVQVVSISDYRRLRPDHPIADYLEKYDIEHLMLTGIHSSYGLAWITLYRFRHGACAGSFSNDDAEAAKYAVPGVLYQWQCLTQPRREASGEMSAALAPLERDELQIVLLKLQGMLNKTIQDKLQVKEDRVKDVLKKARHWLGVSGRKLTPQDLEKTVKAKGRQ